MLTEDHRKMQTLLKGIDGRWGEHKRADPKYLEYQHFLTALAVATRDREVVESSIAAELDPSDETKIERYRITLLTDRTWVTAVYPGDPLRHNVRILPRSHVESVSVITDVPEEVYRTDEVYEFSVVIAGERMNFDSDSATHKGGNLTNLLSEALSDLAKR